MSGSKGVEVEEVVTRDFPHASQRDDGLKQRLNDDLRQLGRALRLTYAPHAGAYFKALSKYFSQVLVYLSNVGLHVQQCPSPYNISGDIISRDTMSRHLASHIERKTEPGKGSQVSCSVEALGERLERL